MSKSKEYSVGSRVVSEDTHDTFSGGSVPAPEVPLAVQVYIMVEHMKHGPYPKIPFLLLTQYLSKYFFLNISFQNSLSM